MKTLVIHPKDVTTDFLSEIYLDKDRTVINENVSKKHLKKSIKEHDRIVMLGHGTPHGLLGFKHFVIDSTYVQLLRDKICVCVWCNADVFVKKYGLNGLYTGMIISEVDEAHYNGIDTTHEFIDDSNKLFAKSIKESIDGDEILTNITNTYIGEGNPIIEFNQQRIYYKN